MPHRLAESPKVVGAKQTLKAIQNGQIELVYLARDADCRVTSPIRDVCERQGIGIIEIESMAELGKACSIEVGSAVAAVLKIGSS
ncbi:MAG TPA: 50S ribosomal protein L7Ae-like protein [Firmicutes bacterium]|nr:50S ribosomal protein L7Ae-like protein [Bacillota bacterium]